MFKQWFVVILTRDDLGVLLLVFLCCFIRFLWAFLAGLIGVDSGS